MQEENFHFPCIDNSILIDELDKKLCAGFLGLVTRNMF